MSTLVFPNLVPGMQASSESVEKRILWGPPDYVVVASIVLDSTTVDARSTNTNELLPGLCLGRITSSKKYKNYSPTATDGSQQEQLAVLAHPVNMKDKDGTARDQLAYAVVAGALLNGECGGLDNFFRAGVYGRIFFDDTFSYPFFGGWRDVVAKTADYTVTAADNGTIFTNKGAAGAVNFTLPALAKGLRYRFFAEAAQTLKITSAAADTLAVFNDAAADSISFETANEIIGGAFEVIANSDATKWLVFVMLGAETQTPTVAT